MQGQNQPPSKVRCDDKMVQNTNFRHSKWKHGYSRTGVHNVWIAMTQRCTNPKCPNWKNYGARGITVCERWKTFMNFLEDMGPRPKGMTLERINNQGNYEPGNCRWASYHDQQRNRRDSRPITYNGVTKSQIDWSLEMGGPKNLVCRRINNLGWSPERAITTPIKKKFIPKKWRRL